MSDLIHKKKPGRTSPHGIPWSDAPAKHGTGRASRDNQKEGGLHPAPSSGKGGCPVLLPPPPLHFDNLASPAWLRVRFTTSDDSKEGGGGGWVEVIVLCANLWREGSCLDPVVSPLGTIVEPSKPWGGDPEPRGGQNEGPTEGTKGFGGWFFLEGLGNG